MGIRESCKFLHGPIAQHDLVSLIWLTIIPDDEDPIFLVVKVPIQLNFLSFNSFLFNEKARVDKMVNVV